MAAVLWMLAWLPQVLPAMSDLPQPVNPILNSSHFSHMLRWEAGPGTPAGVYYHVSVHRKRGTSWKPVLGCEHVQHPLVCNLTEAFSNPREVYYTQIKALLEAQESQAVFLQGFKPIRDTDMDLPLLTVTSCAEDLCVDLEPPMEHLRAIYDSLHYTVRIKSNSAERDQNFSTSLGKKIVKKNLVSGLQYCVSVRFSDTLAPRQSNYSPPVCQDFSPGHYTADIWISSGLCLLVMFVLVFGALLIYTGFTHLTRRPSVLTTIRHIEEVPVIPSRRTSLSSLLNLKATPPSSGEKMRSQTSDESDGESVTESTGWDQGYHLRGGTNLLSSSSLSSSSVAATLSAKHESPNLSSKQTDCFSPVSTETQTRTGLMEPLSSHSGSLCDPLPSSDQRSHPIIQPKEEEAVGREGDSQDVKLLTLTFGGHGEEEEEEAVGREGDSQDVNLLTLTFGGHCEEEEEEEEEDAIPTLLPQTGDTTEADIETVPWSVDEEEEEEDSGYKGRPCAAVYLQKFF